MTTTSDNKVAKNLCLTKYDQERLKMIGNFEYFQKILLRDLSQFL